MIKYYTRACNFFHGNLAKQLVAKKKALPLCGIKDIAFDQVELFTRKKRSVKVKLIKIKEIQKLNRNEQTKIKKDLKKITSKRKNFLKNINFNTPSIMGIINLTPDSFSDGGKYNQYNKSLKHISTMVNSGADIIDVGGESSRPGSKTISSNKEWKRIKNVIKNFKKIYKNKCLSLDTKKLDLMVKGIKYKVDIINDISGFRYDPNSLKYLKKYKIPKVLHHMQGTPDTMQISPKYQNVLLDIYDFFEENRKRLLGKKLY